MAQRTQKEMVRVKDDSGELDDGSSKVNADNGENHCASEHSTAEKSKYQENVEVNRFYEALLHTVSRSVKSFRESVTCLCAESTSGRRERLRSASDKIAAQLLATVKEDMEALVDEQRLAEKIYLLSLLEKEQTNWTGQIAWRPSRDPNRDIEDHIYPLMEHHKQQLQAHLEECKKENSRLETEVSVGRLRLKTIVDNTDQQTRKFEKECKGIVARTAQTSPPQRTL
ncbi:uncharacterized protein LOC135388826 [Ornithodoros turicata]|uniref:uncharacterized protein LOC135388826 n=1 Tax=Ornithodoros turicata TaxID=34597 RepID=UPI003139699F